MPDIHLLAKTTSLTRLQVAETLVAATPADGGAVEATTARLTAIRRVLDVDLTVVEALDARARARPVLPPPRSLQDLVRQGRRRLERERIAGSRGWHGLRLAAVDTLGAVLR